MWRGKFAVLGEPGKALWMSPEDRRGQAGGDLLLGAGPTHLCGAASRPRTSDPNPAAPCASGCGHRSHPVVVGAPWLGPIAGRLGGHRVGSAMAGQPGQALSLPVLCQDKTPQGLSAAFQFLQAQNVCQRPHKS